MIIKKYLGNSLDETKQKMLEELGPEAMTLSVREVRHKGWRGLIGQMLVEMTAAVDENDLRTFNKEKFKVPPVQQQEEELEPEGVVVGSNLTKKAKDEQLSESLKDMQRLLGSDPRNLAVPVPPAPVHERQEASVTYGDPRIAKKPIMNTTQDQVSLSPEAQQTVQDSSSSVDTGEIKKVGAGLIEAFSQSVALTPDSDTVTQKPIAIAIEEEPSVKAADIRALVQEELNKAREQQEPEAHHDHGDLSPSAAFLISKGVNRKIVLEIDETLDERFGKEENLDSSFRAKRINGMKQEIAKRIQVAGPLTFRPGQATKVAIVGPTGVGKTTTLVKIAVQNARDLGKRVAIISLDRSKIGASEQIQGLCQKFRIPVTVASTIQDFQVAVAEFEDKDLVLIDTSGRSQYHWDQVDELAALLESVDDVQVLLALSSTTKDIDVLGCIDQFKRINVDSLIFTKLDETIAHGFLLNVSVQTSLPISYLTVGQQVPGDIRVADAQDIARGLLVKHNSSEFQCIRQLVHV